MANFFGVCYGPYRSLNPPKIVPIEQIQADLRTVKARGFTNIRTYGTTEGDLWVIPAAADQALQVAAGVRVEQGNAELTQGYIDQALQQASEARATVTHVVIGNEVDRTDVATYTPGFILQMMAYARQQIQSKYPNVTAKVISCFSGRALENDGSPWTKVVDACDRDVFLTVYPWYAGQAGGANPADISRQMAWSWDHGLKQVAARGKRIVVAEIGWPSAGGYLASVQNEQLNYGVTRKFFQQPSAPQWALDAFWFEMFDEPWKTGEGPQGPHWGLYTSGTNPQPKFTF